MKINNVQKFLQQELNQAIHINFCLSLRKQKLINYGCNHSSSLGSL